MALLTNEIKNIEKEIESLSVSMPVNNPKVSVIIPVYNTEKYIGKCLFYLTKQTLSDIEIIIVNDGSTDDSIKIISLFAKHDKRIKVIEQEHKLQGAARNAGMEVAKGEYIGFVDSDDWVDFDYFEKLYNAAKKHDSDIAIATNVRIGNGKTKYRLNLKEEKVATSFQDKVDMGKQAKNPCPTNKIYRRSMLEQNVIKWPEGVYCEDKLFTIKAVYYANGMVTVPNIYYYYFRNPNSTIKLKDKKHFKKIIEDRNFALRSVLNFLTENNAPIRDKEFWAVLKEIRIFGVNIFKIEESLKTVRFVLFGITIFSFAQKDLRGEK